MEVFVYHLPGQFTIKASTNDLSSPWKKFCARIAKPLEYCSYDSDTEGELMLYDYENKAIAPIDKERRSAAQPVFFESNSYSFTIYFENIQNGTEPHIIHPDKRVSEMFNCETIGDKAFLSGAINFLNQPGRFRLKFAYTPMSGNEKEHEVSFDVVSPKLDTKDDLKIIISEIRAEYDDLVFRYLTLTYQQMAAGREANNEIVWLAVFKEIIKGYLNAVRYILHRPHFRDIHIQEYSYPERIKRWTPALAERFMNDRKDDEEKALRTLYSHEQSETTEDTRENRFVKYTVIRITERLRIILKRIQNMKDENVSKDESNELQAYVRELEKLERNSFFRTIGRFEGFRQESIVLQQRTGYAQVYRFWLMLQNGLDLVAGRTSVGVLPIWQLYEVWCFLKVKQIVRNLLNIDPHNPDDQQYIKEEKSTMFNPFADTEMSDSVEYTNKVNGDVIELGYQYSYDRETKGVHSETVLQKPDIVMNVHKKKGGMTLTYLFDAKYRVQGDDDQNVAKEVIDYPVQDTLNQMHRYRDAIYYSDGKKREMSKEVIGAYILFPGRLNEKHIQDLIDKKDFDNKDLPYYIRSIYQVNIGAYPLLPNEESGMLLEKQIDNIIEKETVKEQIVDSIPQRGLYYTTEQPLAHDIVLFGCVKDDDHWAWIKEHGWYNVRLQVYGDERKDGLQTSAKLLGAKHFVLYKFIDENEPLVEILGIFDLSQGDDAPMFMDYTEMNSKRIKYPRKLGMYDRFLVYRIDMENNSSFNPDRDTLKQKIEIMQSGYKVGEDRGIAVVKSLYELYSNVITD